MKTLPELFVKNKAWAEKIKKEDPSFFEKLSKQQAPKYLWIGCSDSRVPANMIVGLQPGEVFVHRNVANLVVQTDFNCLSVLQYAVEVLKVEHIIVCGHYGCGGVGAVLQNSRLGLIDNWLADIRDVYRDHGLEVDSLKTEKEKHDKLCELNVKRQAENVLQTTVVQNAIEKGQKLFIHAWIYSIENGLLKDLKV